MNLPAFERIDRAHIPRGVPDEWRSVQAYTLQDLKDALKKALPDGKAPGSHRVTAALIAKLQEPMHGLLVHACQAILRGAKVPESWHEAQGNDHGEVGCLQTHSVVAARHGNAYDPPHVKVHSSRGS